MVTIVVLSLIGLSLAYSMKKRGRNPIAWLAVGVLLALAMILILAAIPFLLLLILLGLFVSYAAMNKRKRQPPSRPTENQASAMVIEVQAERIQKAPQSLEETSWYYLNGAHQQQGPAMLNQLKELANNDKITPKTYIWHEGMTDWKRIEELADLKETLFSRP